MWVEVSITLCIIAVAGYVIYNSLKTMCSENCECGNCSPKQQR